MVTDHCPEQIYRKNRNFQLSVGSNTSFCTGFPMILNHDLPFGSESMIALVLPMVLKP